MTRTFPPAATRVLARGSHLLFVRSTLCTSLSALAFTLLLALPFADASRPQDMLFRAGEVLTVSPKSFEVMRSESQEMYRFAKQKLFIQSPEREEYSYGDLTQIDLTRFVVGHKTIIFTSSEFTAAIVIHSNTTEVRITTLSRVKT